MSDPLGRFAEHASKPYPTDHIYPSALIAFWEKHFAWEYRYSTPEDLRDTLSATQAEIQALENRAYRPELISDARATRIDKLQGKERAVAHLLERGKG